MIPLACLIAIAVCAFTAAGNDRLHRGRAVDQTGQPGGPDQLRAPSDPVAGRDPAPDREDDPVVLDELDPRGLDPGLLWPLGAAAHIRSAADRGAGAARPGALPGRQERLARGRPAAVAVDQQDLHGASRAPTTAGSSLLGMAQGIAGASWITLRLTSSANGTSPASPRSCQPLDLAGAVVTFNTLRTVPANLASTAEASRWRDCVAVVKAKTCGPLCRPGRGAALAPRSRPTTSPATPGTAAPSPHPGGRPCQRPGLPRRPPGHQDHPLAGEHGHRRTPARPSTPSPAWPAPAAAQDLARLVSDHWSIEARDHMRAVTFVEDARPAAPAAGPPTWPPSGLPSSRPSRTPATCTSPKEGATTAPPPKPSASTASIRTRTDIHGTRRSPGRLPPPGAGDLRAGAGGAEIPATAFGRCAAEVSAAIRRSPAHWEFWDNTGDLADLGLIPPQRDRSPAAGAGPSTRREIPTPMDQQIASRLGLTCSCCTLPASMTSASVTTCCSPI